MWGAALARRDEPASPGRKFLLELERSEQL